MKKSVFILSFIIYTSLLAQRTVSIDFDLYQNAANNMIAMTEDFPINYSGSVLGNSYFFQLEQPTIQFNQGYMVLNAVLKISTTPTGYLELSISPQIFVNYSISTDDVTGYLNEFESYINIVLSSLPQWVRDKIIEHYESLELKMYPVKLLEYAESYVPDFLDIEISNIGFSVISLSGKLQIGIDFDVTGNQPNYQCYTYNRTQIKITSNVRADVKRLTLYNVLGQTYYDFNGTSTIQKDGGATFNCYHPNNQTNYQSGRYIRVLLQSEVRGTFLRLYDASIMNIDNQWSGPKPVQINID